jgi:DNA-binding transcriptional MerR regulator
MSHDRGTFDLTELADLAGVTPRTVRYYIQQGLLSPPSARGPGAHYDHAHLDRLNLIKRLQREHLPLAEIRKQVRALDDRTVHELARSKPKEARSSALDYVRSVLEGNRPHTMLAAAAPPPAMLAAAVPERHSAPRAAERSQWERITLAPDVELHVRRPLTREQNRLVEQLLEAARKLFEEEVP